MADITKIRWWQWVPVFGWRIVAVVESADDVPRRLPRNGAILVGPPARPKWVVFDCPCRRGHRIMLNTDKNRSPRWSTTVKGKLTISPSIDYRERAPRCHYFVRKGRVMWVNERKRQ
jgi:hypothetical protein